MVPVLNFHIRFLSIIPKLYFFAPFLGPGSNSLWGNGSCADFIICVIMVLHLNCRNEMCCNCEHF